MKKSVMILGNALIVGLLLGLTLSYVSSENKITVATQTEAFANMTVAMESVTTNYLLGEQQVCNSWATYIDGNDMTAEEAIAYVRKCIAMPGVTAHILFEGDSGLYGLSTAAKPSDPKDFTVSYGNISAFSNGFHDISKESGVVNATRAYTNPTNAIQSIAFCCPITVRNGQTKQSAMLLRIIPVSSFAQKWSFPTEEYKDAEISLIDTVGDYIIKGHSFKNSNFFEFYQSYNNVTPAEIEKLKKDIEGDSGVFEIMNSAGEQCLIAHARIDSTDDWTIVTMIRVEDLGHATINWTMVIIITTGLLVLLVFNLLAMMNFNRQLQVAVDAADRANQAKTDFLSTMSHDIRTPMNAIIGLTAIMGKKLDDTASVKENLRKINMASNHLLTLINDILDISKVESGKLTLSPIVFSIVECAENLVNISQPMVKEKNIDFSFHVDNMQEEWLLADQLRLNQVFINLLSNAIKYTQPGGKVCVTMREEEGEAEKMTRLTYQVADTGIGMTPEFMERMYQPFSRQTDSRVNAIQGTGLGLAITKQMIDLMHGTIDCQSEVGKGTTFTVTLDIPLADRQPDEMELPYVKVLLVDDDEVLLETAKDTLESIGAETYVAHSGAEALQMVSRQSDYQVVIVDWKMPDADGVDVARQIREKIKQEIPILMISAYDTSELEDAAKDAGIDGFVMKPLFRSTLYLKLKEVLGMESDPANQDDDATDIAGMRILVAEDNDINWEIISMLLQMHGVETQRANNGKEAVECMEHAQKGSFHLIFMDIQMPEMNGIDATKAIRALKDPWASQIPIIAMTADAFSENIAECLAAGMNGHIAKPIDVKVVLSEIKKIKEEAKE